MRTNQLPLGVARLLTNIFIACLFGFIAGKAYNNATTKLIFDVEEAITGVNHSIAGDFIVTELYSSNEYVIIPTAVLPKNYTCDVLKESKMNMFDVKGMLAESGKLTKEPRSANDRSTDPPPRESRARSDTINTS